MYNLRTTSTLTLYLLMWRIWWAPNNASKGQIGFNSAFKGLNSFWHSEDRLSWYILIKKSQRDALFLKIKLRNSASRVFYYENNTLLFKFGSYVPKNRKLGRTKVGRSCFQKRIRENSRESGFWSAHLVKSLVAWHWVLGWVFANVSNESNALLLPSQGR